jgi:hypothetical protein
MPALIVFEIFGCEKLFVLGFETNIIPFTGCFSLVVLFISLSCFSFSLFLFFSLSLSLSLSLSISLSLSLSLFFLFR